MRLLGEITDRRGAPIGIDLAEVAIVRLGENEPPIAYLEIPGCARVQVRGTVEEWVQKVNEARDPERFRQERAKAETEREQQERERIAGEYGFRFNEARGPYGVWEGPGSATVVVMRSWNAPKAATQFRYTRPGSELVAAIGPSFASSFEDALRLAAGDGDG